jgi:thioredoxin 1
MLWEVIRMVDLNNDELEKIRKKKLRELINNQQGGRSAEKEQNWPNTPIVVNDSTFAQTIKKYPMVVIDCWAQWCGPCHMIAPVIEELARDYSGKIVFGKLNTEENRISTNRYNIMSIPTLLVFKNGKLADQLVGAMPREMLEPMITKHLPR